MRLEEDCNSGIPFGGNKVRKLESLAAEAIDSGCDTLVSIGGIQPNHTRQVTGVACKLGLKAVTVQEAGSSTTTCATTRSATLS